MPAIDISHLKSKCAMLADDFSNHIAFIHRLHDILDTYTNHTKRASLVARKYSLPTYHTPTPVMRQIERELDPCAERYPSKGVTLAMELWKDGSLESRILSAKLVGMIPPADAISILVRLPDWLGETSDKVIRETIFRESLARIRKEAPSPFFSLVEGWLASEITVVQTWGLNAIVPLLEDPGFENLPAVFTIIKPALLRACPATQLEIQACIIALGKISKIETINYLRGLLTNKPPSLMVRTIRRMRPVFSTELQEALREVFQGKENQC